MQHLYDAQYGGWGDVHKFIDAAALELTYTMIDGGDASALQHARQTLDANLRLIDPVWGGVYQYSDEVGLNFLTSEKLMPFQADDLRLYSEAVLEGPSLLSRPQNLCMAADDLPRGVDGGFWREPGRRCLGAGQRT